MTRVNLDTSLRLFVPDRLAAGTDVNLSSAQARYVTTVMRRAAGDPVRLFNGADGEWAARIAQAARDRAVLHVDSLLRPQADDGPDLILAFALLKRDATDLVVQKATELGVRAIHPVITQRTQAARVNLERLRTIAIEAAEQSERLTIPQIHEPVGLGALLRDWDPNRRFFAALERRAAPTPSPHFPAALLTGPEGGWTDQEIAMLSTQPFVTPISLGPLILRAETAALAGLVLLQAGHPG